MKKYDVVLCDAESGEMVEMIHEDIGGEDAAIEKVERLGKFIDNENFFVDMWIRYPGEFWKYSGIVWTLETV